MITASAYLMYLLHLLLHGRGPSLLVYELGLCVLLCKRLKVTWNMSRVTERLGLSSVPGQCPHVEVRVGGLRFGTELDEPTLAALPDSAQLAVPWP